MQEDRTIRLTCSFCGKDFTLILAGKPLLPSHALPEHPRTNNECPGGGTSVRLLLTRVILKELQVSGFILTAQNGKLLVSPATQLTSELTERIRELKVDLLAELEWRKPTAADKAIRSGWDPFAEDGPWTILTWPDSNFAVAMPTERLMALDEAIRIRRPQRDAKLAKAAPTKKKAAVVKEPDLSFTAETPDA